jgi:virulence-associated protein VagC
MPRTAKLFRNGGRQAVRLPAGLRFGEPDSWASFFELTEQVKVAEDFMSARGDQAPQERELF